jgi:hypothetical protein
MATQARNPHPVSVLESVAPRVAQDPDPSPAGRSLLSSLGLGSFGKATGALGAPVAGLIVLAAIGAASTGVGAGLGSLPGKPPLRGSSGLPAAAQSGQSDAAGRLLRASGAGLGHGGGLRGPAALASLAGSLASHAVAGAGVSPRGASAPNRQPTRAGGGSSIPTSSSGAAPVNSTGPRSNSTLQPPSDTQSLGGQPQGSSQPQNQGQQQGQAQPEGQPAPRSQRSPSDTGSPTTSTTSSGSSGSSESSSPSSTSSSQPTTTSSSSPQTTGTSTSSPQRKSTAPTGGAGTTPTTTTTPTQS